MATLIAMGTRIVKSPICAVLSIAGMVGEPKNSKIMDNKGRSPR
jgi:hypothetical protein